jgi:3-oxoacyl-[acyl-carrier protein] reductase
VTARGRLAVVTGGTKGIGRALARRLAKLDHHVVALYRSDKASAKETVEELGGRVTTLCLDVADAAEVTAFAEELVAEHGAPHVLVNNAGRNIDGPFLEMSHDDWRQVLDANLSGPFYVTRALAPAMLALGDGVSIVNLGATTAIRPRLNGANYCASKAGLLHLTKCLALELAPAIRVNCLIPGMIDTEEMRTRFRTDDPRARADLLAEIPQRRIGGTDEMADALEFLVSDASRYVTGQKIIVDGGQFMW